jgi:hypothetical protein
MNGMFQTFHHTNDFTPNKYTIKLIHESQDFYRNIATEPAGDLNEDCRVDFTDFSPAQTLGATKKLQITDFRGFSRIEYFV